MQLTEHLADVVEDHDRFDAVRERCKTHLSADCFYDPDRGEYRAPLIPTVGDRGLA